MCLLWFFSCTTYIAAYTTQTRRRRRGFCRDERTQPTCVKERRGVPPRANNMCVCVCVCNRVVHSTCTLAQSRHGERTRVSFLYVCMYVCVCCLSSWTQSPWSYPSFGRRRRRLVGVLTPTQKISLSLSLSPTIRSHSLSHSLPHSRTSSRNHRLPRSTTTKSRNDRTTTTRTTTTTTTKRGATTSLLNQEARMNGWFWTTHAKTT